MQKKKNQKYRKRTNKININYNPTIIHILVYAYPFSFLKKHVNILYKITHGFITLFSLDMSIFSYLYLFFQNIT